MGPLANNNALQQRHYPRSLTFKRLLAPPDEVPTTPTSDDISESIASSIEDDAVFPFGDARLPDELRVHILSFCDSFTLFQLSRTSRQARFLALEVLFSQRHLWFLYHAQTFGRHIPAVAAGDFANPGVLAVEDFLAARLVTQLQIASGAVDATGSSASWSYLADDRFWDRMLEFFPSLRRVMIRVKEQPAQSQLDSGQVEDPNGASTINLPEQFWKSLAPRTENVSIWLEIGMPGLERYYKLNPRHPVAIRGNSPSLARTRPDLSMSVFVDDYVTLPPMSGAMGLFTRWRHEIEWEQVRGIVPFDHWSREPLPKLSDDLDLILHQMVNIVKMRRCMDHDLANSAAEEVNKLQKDMPGMQVLSELLREWGEPESAEREAFLERFETQMLEQQLVSPGHELLAVSEDAHLNTSSRVRSAPVFVKLENNMKLCDELKPLAAKLALEHPDVNVSEPGSLNKHLGDWKQQLQSPIARWL